MMNNFCQNKSFFCPKNAQSLVFGSVLKTPLHLMNRVFMTLSKTFVCLKSIKYTQKWINFQILASTLFWGFKLLWQLQMHKNRTTINPFLANIPFLYPLIKSENLWLSNVFIFRSNKNERLAPNELPYNENMGQSIQQWTK